MALFGADIDAVGWKDLVTRNSEFLHLTHSMDEALERADVIMMLRVQFERMNESFFPSVREYFRYYGLTRTRSNARNPMSSSCIPARSTAAWRSRPTWPTVRIP